MKGESSVVWLLGQRLQELRQVRLKSQSKVALTPDDEKIN